MGRLGDEDPSRAFPAEPLWQGLEHAVESLPVCVGTALEKRQSVTS
jgi:hypothetical protein